jgi:tRNA(fMet)-specific endonuclease VapC
VGQILAMIAVLSLESPIEFHYAEVRAYLLREGMPIDENDLLIASPLQKNIQRHSHFG